VKQLAQGQGSVENEGSQDEEVTVSSSKKTQVTSNRTSTGGHKTKAPPEGCPVIASSNIYRNTMVMVYFSESVEKCQYLDNIFSFVKCCARSDTNTR
jgi:hypothetical protein